MPESQEDELRVTSAYAPAFEPILVGNQAVALIARIVQPTGAPVVSSPLWRRAFSKKQDAQSRFQWMLARQDRWAIWARLARVIGPEDLETMMAAEAAADAEAAEKARQRAHDEALDLATIYMEAVEQDRSFQITMQRGRRGEPFFRMRFAKEAEQDRVWDWVRWSGHAYHRWAEIFDRKGHLALEKVILEDMLKEEHRVKAAGLSAGGRRPLRFWRGNGA